MNNISEPGVENSLKKAPAVSIDTGLFCLVNMAAFHGKNVNLEQIQHRYAIADKIDTITILRAARDLELKAKVAKIKCSKLTKLPLPLIGQLNSGEYVIIGQLKEDKILILKAEGGTEIISKTEFENIWSGEVILMIPKKLNPDQRKFGISWFIPTIIQFKMSFIEVLTSTFFIQILGILTPIITQVVIDKVLVHNSVTTLDVLAFALVAIILFETLIGIAKGYIFNNAVSKVDVILGAKLFRHLFSLPLMYFESRRVGDTVARVREVENIRRFLTGAPLNTLIDLPFLVIYLVVMFFYSPKLTLIVIISLPLFAGLSLAITPLFKKRLDEKFFYGAESQSYLVESITGVQTVKSLALEPTIEKKWEECLASYTKAGYKTTILANNANTTSQMISKVFDVLILWFGAHLVMEGNITIGQLVAFRMLSSRVSGPVLRLVSLWQEFQQTSLSIQRLGDIFNAKPEPSMDGSKTRMPTIEGLIKFEKVRFRYRPDASEVIRDMSFEIPQGKIIGVVGRSGSGKSTLSKLIQRLYIPEAGKISIDGIDISMADPAWLRSQIGVVLQENFLFTGSVRENIVMNKPSASADEVVNVAKIAGAHDFILDLSEGYDTIVGERGTGLSGGQKQRVAIARALLNNPRILIFDEATSALDYESESIIQNNLKDICKGRTVIIIAHRLSTLRDADLIMSIDRGVLLEYDTHEALLATDGLYHYLHKQQERT